MSDSEPTVGAVRAVSEALKPAIEAGCTLLLNLAGPGTKELGSWLGDLVRSRKDRLAEIGDLLAEELDRRGVPARAIDPEYLLSVCESACRASDRTLREMWARLLASAVESDKFQHPMFVDRLRQMSGDDARAFEVACSNADKHGLKGPVPPEERPFWSVAPLTPENGRLEALGLIEWFRPSTFPYYTSIPSHLGFQLRAAVRSSRRT